MIWSARGRRLAVDANGRFDLPTAVAYGEAMAQFGLRWYEEPLDPLDYAAHAELAPRIRRAARRRAKTSSPPGCTEPSAPGGTPARPGHPADGPRPLLRAGRIPPDAGGAEGAGLVPRRCIPHGGHQFALNLAAGLGLGGNETYPEVFAPFGGFADSTPIWTDISGSRRSRASASRTSRRSSMILHRSLGPLR